MTYVGIVRDGKIELPEGARLPEGAAVRIEYDEKSRRAAWDMLAGEI